MSTIAHVWQNNEEKIEWQAWRNQFAFDLPTPNGTGKDWMNYETLFRFMRGQTFTQINTIGIAFFGSANGDGNANGPAWFSVFNGFRNTGDLIPKEEVFWRWAAQWNKARPTGRPHRIFIHGSVDESDISHSNGKGIVWKTWRDRVELFENIKTEYGSGMWDKQLTTVFSDDNATGQFTDPCLLFYPRGVADIHAETRWRKRMKGDAIGCFDSIMKWLRQAANLFEYFENWRNYGIPFIYGQQFYDSVAVLQGSGAVVSKIKDLKDSKTAYGQEQGTTVVGRFGLTIEDVYGFWQKFDGQVQATLPGLLALYRPYTDAAGDEYIKMIDQQGYQDLIQEGIGGVTRSLLFDWFNPLLYEGQQSDDDLKHVPDAIGLRL